MANRYRRRPRLAAPKGFYYSDPEREADCARHKAEYAEPVMKYFDKAPKIVRDATNQHGDDVLRMWVDHGIRPRRELS